MSSENLLGSSEYARQAAATGRAGLPLRATVVDEIRVQPAGAREVYEASRALYNCDKDFNRIVLF